MLTTDGGLLGGRVHYRQPATGFRSGIEPVILAATLPAAHGERVLEAGTGAGPALLCLHARVPGVQSVGVEIDPETACLAAANAAANGLIHMTVLTGDILSVALPDGFDHAIANPPYHPPGPTSPQQGRERAKRAGPTLIADWISRLSGSVRHHGTLTMVLPAGAIPAALGAIDAVGCGGCVLFPLWPKPGRAAKLVLLRAVKGSRAPFRVAAGLVLHGPDGGFTEAAQAVLRNAAPLTL